MTFYLDCNYRDMENWLLVSDRIYRVLDLHEIPDHSTLWRAFHKLNVRLLRALPSFLLQSMCLKEMAIGIDSTGFSTEQASAYYSFRNGRPKKTGSKALMRWYDEPIHSRNVFQLWTLPRLSTAQKLTPPIQKLCLQKVCLTCRRWF